MIGNIKTIALYIILIPTCFFLFYNTGIHGDDYTAVKYFNDKKFAEIFIINPLDLGIWIYVLPAYLFFYIFYNIFGTDFIFGYELLKFTIHIFSTFFLYKFFYNFITQIRSIIASLFFVFFISHDSTTYWYMASAYMLFFPSLVFYSFHLIYNNFLFRGSILLAICSLCYSTPPIIFGLSIFFLLKKEFLKFFIFLSAGLFFVLYYFTISNWFPVTENRIDDNLTLVILLKNFIFQFLSSLDSTIGLNIIYKLYYSLSYLNVTSISLSILVVVGFFINLKKNNKSDFNFQLFISLLAIYLSSLMMFSLTGMYTQSSFNLGNRVTIYFCIFLGYILILIKNKNVLIFIVSLILVFPSISISQHWKQWNSKQIIIYENINKNYELNKITDEILVVEKNNYSKLGPFSHIELFSMNWHLETVFENIINSKNIISLTSYTKIYDNEIIDPKSNKVVVLNDLVYMYDTELDIVKKITKKDIVKKLDEIEEVRHWSQLLNKDNLIIKLILFLNPRLNYLF